MSIPESDIVSVSVSIEQAAVTQSGTSLLAILGTSTVLPSGNRYGIYSDMDDVGAVFPSNAPEYLAAQLVFSRSPAPTQVMIARMFAAATAAELLGSLAPTTNLATYDAINNGALSLSIDGVVENISGIDLTGSGSLNAVAAHIQTAIDAIKAGVSVTYSQGQFIIRSGTTGINSALTFTYAAPAGTDLAPLLGLRQIDGGTLSPGYAAESVTQSLGNIQAVFGDWYLFGLADAPTDQNIQDAAAWALANSKIYGYYSNNASIVNPALQADIAYVLQQTANKRVIGIYDLAATNPYAIFSALAEASTIDFTGADTTETLMFKQLPGVSVSRLSESQKRSCDGKNISYYVSVGGNPMFMKARMADGTPFDQVQGLDWLAQALGTAAFGGLYAAKKIQQTDKGMAIVLHWLENPLQQAVRNGLLAPGIWNGAPVGQIQTGQQLTKGYYSFAGSMDDQAQSIRNTRIGPPIQIIAKGAGALEGLNILVNFEP